MLIKRRDRGFIYFTYFILFAFTPHAEKTQSSVLRDSAAAAPLSRRAECSAGRTAAAPPPAEFEPRWQRNKDAPKRTTATSWEDNFILWVKCI